MHPLISLLDAGSFQADAVSASLMTGTGALGGRAVRVAATDPSLARGALGAAESDVLGATFRTAREAGTPVVLLLDSAGARVDGGLPALGAFRRMFREALQARLAGVPMLAVLGRSCFGGASMLACLCERRLFSPQTRLATSGPAIIQAVEGRERFDAQDRAAVDALIGARARVCLLPGDAIVVLEQDSARQAALHWLTNVIWPSPYDIEAHHATLGQRAGAAGLLPTTAPTAVKIHERLQKLLPAGYVPNVNGEMFCALPEPGSGKAVFAGCISGVDLGATACWQLADQLLRLPVTHPGSPVVLVLDAESHAVSVRDERVLLSEYLVHLSLTIAWLVAGGHRSVLWLPGAAAGAAYVAFAAPVERVVAFPSARVMVLPVLAQQQIIGETLAEASDVRSLVNAGVADGLLDDPL
jgi:malonate decarboxylase beta subunit